jgi:MtaA/CmuA family methyltransferase
MGAAVDFPGDNQPMAGTGEALVSKPSDVDRIPPPDPSSQGRWPLMLEALARIDEAIGGQVFVVACLDQYPFSLACALMGMDRLMLALIDDRPLVDALLERCVEYAVAYGSALAAAGADMLSGGDSPAGLIGPTRYREVALLCEQRVVRELKRTTDRPISLHICGDATPILADMAQSGADVLELDHHVDVQLACRVLGPDIAIWGNVDPVGVLSQGGPQEVARATENLIESLEHAGHRRFVLSSGCTLAMETPAENLHAMIAAAH